MGQACEVLSRDLHYGDVRYSSDIAVDLFKLEHAIIVVGGNTLDAFRSQVFNPKRLRAKVAVVLATDKDRAVKLRFNLSWELFV